MSTNKATKEKVTASVIERLLRRRYDEKHYCTAEIKAGAGNERMDFVAIQASWTHPIIHGFEIKVSRADFMKDDKWEAYLPSCKQFWFVTAQGVMKRDEVPPQAGWIEVSSGGINLVTRKKAPSRDMTPDAEARLFRQIIHRLHYRAWEDPEKTREKQLQAFLETAADRRELGRRVGSAVRETVLDAREQVAASEKRIAGYAALESALAAKGITLDQIIAVGHKPPTHRQFLAENLIRKLYTSMTEENLPRLRSMKELAKELNSSAATYERAILRAVMQIEKACENHSTGEWLPDGN